MSRHEIEDEERIAQERVDDHLADLIRGTIGEIDSPRKAVVSLPKTSTVAHAVEMMIENSVGAVLVVEDEELYGLFSERDVLKRVVAENREPAVTLLEDVMTPNPQCLNRDHEIVYALNRMTVGGFRHIPILNDQDRPDSMLSMRDVMEHIVSFYSTEVFNLPDAPGRQVSSKREGA